MPENNGESGLSQLQEHPGWDECVCVKTITKVQL